MRFFGVVLFFGGYMLIYSSVARGGVLATDPWASLWIDAYTGETSSPVDPTTFTTNNQGDVIARIKTATGYITKNMGLGAPAVSANAGNPGMVSGPPTSRRRLNPNSPIPKNTPGV